MKKYGVSYQHPQYAPIGIIRNLIGISDEEYNLKYHYWFNHIIKGIDEASLKAKTKDNVENEADSNYL